MRKEYRIDTSLGPDFNTPLYAVQVKTWIGTWVNVKTFYDPADPAFAKMEAEELVEKLREA